MTEYDYSPEAYERYLATQSRIARWVDETEQHKAQFVSPFVPVPRSEDSSDEGMPFNPTPYSHHSHPDRHHHHQREEHIRGRRHYARSSSPSSDSSSLPPSPVSRTPHHSNHVHQRPIPNIYSNQPQQGHPFQYIPPPPPPPLPIMAPAPMHPMSNVPLAGPQDYYAPPLSNVPQQQFSHPGVMHPHPPKTHHAIYANPPNHPPLQQQQSYQSRHASARPALNTNNSTYIIPYTSGPGAATGYVIIPPNTRPQDVQVTYWPSN